MYFLPAKRTEETREYFILKGNRLKEVREMCCENKKISRPRESTMDTLRTNSPEKRSRPKTYEIFLILERKKREEKRDKQKQTKGQREEKSSRPKTANFIS